jgi:hypothetical protein
MSVTKLKFPTMPEKDQSDISLKRTKERKEKKKEKEIDCHITLSWEQDLNVVFSEEEKIKVLH